MKEKSINKKLESYSSNDECIMFYDLIKLQGFIDDVKYLKSKYNVEFLFPIKSFPNEKIIKLFYKNNFGFDIANENEYNMIKNMIDDNIIISYNGIKLEKLPLKKNYNKLIYNANSIADIKSNYFCNGIRINTYNKKSDDFSKFGISLKNLDNIDFDRIKSISFHFYEEDKNKKVKMLLKYISKLINKFHNLEYINFGGNWNILDVPSLEKKIKIIRDSIDTNIKLLFEPGESWFNSCGYLVTSVIGKNQVGNKKIIYINAIKDSVAKWSVLTPINLNLGNCDGCSYIISGCSCYEKDVFSIIKKNINVSVGDKIIFAGLNGYSYAWVKTFNGSNPPKVVFYE